MNLEEALDFLGLDSTASKEKIKQHCKILAKKYHPDTGGSDSEMKQLTEAKNIALKALKSDHLPIVIEQVEFAVKRFADETNKIRALENKAAELKRVINHAATNKLRQWRNIAIIAAGISTGAIFLGKDFPLESIYLRSLPLISENIEKPSPEPLKKPIDILDKMTSEEKDQAIAFNKNIDKVNKEIESGNQNNLSYYQQNLEKIKKENESRKKRNENLKERSSQLKSAWEAVMFMIGIISGVFAWLKNRNIQRVEQRLTDLDEQTNIKSNFYLLMKDILGNKIMNKWTLKEFQDLVKEWSENEGRMQGLVYIIGPSRFSQLILTKGQQIGLITATEKFKLGDLTEFYQIRNFQNS